MAQKVKMAAKGDRASFIELYSSVYEEWYRLALCCLCSEDAAAEATAENAIYCFSHISEIRRDEQFREWSIKRLCSELMRIMRLTSIAGGYNGEDTAAKPHGIIGEFASLSPDDRLLAALGTECGMTADEIAELIPLKNPAEQLRSAKINLRDNILSADSDY